jgi:hypothetical protein
VGYFELKLQIHTLVTSETYFTSCEKGIIPPLYIRYAACWPAIVFILVFHDGEGGQCGVLLPELNPAANVLKVLVASLELFGVRGEVGVHHTDV